MRMKGIETGSAAFPVTHQVDLNMDTICEAQGGMTLRDYFAAKAMQSLMILYPNSGASGVAVDAYKQADTMLSERKGELG